MAADKFKMAVGLYFAGVTPAEQWLSPWIPPYDQLIRGSSPVDRHRPDKLDILDTLDETG